MTRKAEGYNKRIQDLENELNSYRNAVLELKLLNEIAVTAGRAADVDQTLKLILNKTIDSVNAEFGSILLVSESHEELRTFIKQENNSKIGKRPHIGEHIKGWVLLNKKSLIIENLAADKRFKGSEEELKNIKSLICSPIWFEGKIIGMLLMINKKDGNPFTENDLTLLSIISVQAGQLIKNSELQHLSFEKKKEAEVARLEAEKLQEIDRIKTKFFTNISHEFRTPLTLILGPLEKLMEGKENYSGEKLRLIYNNAGRLLKLINQLLDLSSIDADKMNLDLEEADLITFVKGITASFQPFAEIKNIELIFKSKHEKLIAAFDKDKLEKILSNLLINAIKFTPASSGNNKAGDIIIGIPEDFIVKNNLKMFEIYVEDSGAGMPPETIRNIFDRFFTKRGNLISEMPAGTGIGLALVKELVELHRGSVSAESEVGKGTKFKIELPYDIEYYKDLGLEIIPCNEVDKKKVDEASRGSDKLEKDSRREEIPLILIAEDNEDIRKFIKGSIITDLPGAHKKPGILEAINGKDALEKAADYIPDLIISDVLMPEMDGIRLCEKLKTDERTSHIPVILLTSRSGTENKVKGLETGADDYMTKPFSIAELNARINNLLNQRKLLRQKLRKELILETKETDSKSVDEKFLQRVANTIESHISDTLFSVDRLAKEIGLSRMQLHRKLGALTGRTPNEIIKSYRLNKAAKLLLTKSGNISEVGYEVGFNNPAYFATCFKDYFGNSPSEYLQKFIPESTT